MSGRLTGGYQPVSGSLEGGITPTLPSGRELRVGGTTAKYKTPVGDKRIEKYQYEHILKRFKDQTKPWDCHTNQSSIIQPCSPAQLSRRLVQWEVLGQYGITLNVNLCVRHHRLRRRFAQISFLVLELGPTLLPCKMQ